MKQYMLGSSSQISKHRKGGSDRRTFEMDLTQFVRDSIFAIFFSLKEFVLHILVHGELIMCVYRKKERKNARKEERERKRE